MKTMKKKVKKNVIENDFDRAVQEINVMVQEAARALNTANQLARKAGLNGLVLSANEQDDIYYKHHKNASSAAKEKLYYNELDKLEGKYALIKTSDLMREIDDAGWSTSSMSC